MKAEERRRYERRNLRRTAAVSALRAVGLTDREIADRLGPQGAESPAILAVARARASTSDETRELPPYEWPPDPLADERLTDDERIVARAMGLTVEQMLAARSIKLGDRG